MAAVASLNQLRSQHVAGRWDPPCLPRHIPPDEMFQLIALILSYLKEVFGDQGVVEWLKIAIHVVDDSKGLVMHMEEPPSIPPPSVNVGTDAGEETTLSGPRRILAKVKGGLSRFFGQPELEDKKTKENFDAAKSDSKARHLANSTVVQSVVLPTDIPESRKLEQQIEQLISEHSPRGLLKLLITVFFLVLLQDEERESRRLAEQEFFSQAQRDGTQGSAPGAHLVLSLRFLLGDAKLTNTLVKIVDGIVAAGVLWDYCLRDEDDEGANGDTYALAKTELEIIIAACLNQKVAPAAKDVKPELFKSVHDLRDQIGEDERFVELLTIVIDILHTKHDLFLVSQPFEEEGSLSDGDEVDEHETVTSAIEEEGSEPEDSVNHTRDIAPPHEDTHEEFTAYINDSIHDLTNRIGAPLVACGLKGLKESVQAGDYDRFIDGGREEGGTSSNGAEVITENNNVQFTYRDVPDFLQRLNEARLKLASDINIQEALKDIENSRNIVTSRLGLEIFAIMLDGFTEILDEPESVFDFVQPVSTRKGGEALVEGAAQSHDVDTAQGYIQQAELGSVPESRSEVNKRKRAEEKD